MRTIAHSPTRAALTLALLVACGLALSHSTPAAARGAYAHSTQGLALRTVPGDLPKWAASPVGHTLGTYGATHTPQHGASAARLHHIQRLSTCNPFANVSATKPLATCD